MKLRDSEHEDICIFRTKEGAMTNQDDSSKEAALKRQEEGGASLVYVRVQLRLKKLLIF